MFPAKYNFFCEKYVKTTKNVVKYIEFSFYFFPSSDMSLQLFPCSPWYDVSDEWLFACSGDTTQSEVFPIIPLETTSKNQLARSKKSPVWLSS